MGKSIITIMPIVLLLLIPGFCAAQEAGKLNNKSFTNFGSGLESIGYKEKTVLVGEKIEMKTTFTNPIQSSGAYIPLTERIGLYMTSSATLYSKPSNEDWNDSAVGTIQTDQTKFSWTELNLEGAYHLRPGHHLTAGLNYVNLKFTRFDFKPAAATDAFNKLFNFRLPDGTTFNGTYADWVASPGRKSDDFPGLNPDPDDGAIIEDMNSVVAQIGYRYDSFFADPDAKFRWLCGVRAGLPVYYEVENTSQPGMSIAGSVDKGYDLAANIGVGWNFSEKFSLLTTADWMYKHRSELRDGSLILPENTAMSLQTVLKLNWAF